MIFWTGVAIYLAIYAVCVAGMFWVIRGMGIMPDRVEKKELTDDE